MKNKESILNKINKLIDKYNSISDNKIGLVQNELINTKDLCVCVYDDNQVGLFRKKGYYKKFEYGYYNDFDVYYGIDTDNITAHINHFINKPWDWWYKKGERMSAYNKHISATCTINKEYHLENIRLEMYNEGKLDNYQVGVITSKEIPEILNYVYSKNNKKNKQKVLK